LISQLGSYYAQVQMPEKGLPLLRQAAALAPDDPQVLYRVADGYELLHQRGEGLRWIRRAIERGASLDRIRNDPDFADLLADPRFGATLEKKR
jgi:hypothetical protein